LNAVVYPAFSLRVHLLDRPKAADATGGRCSDQSRREAPETTNAIRQRRIITGDPQGAPRVVEVMKAMYRHVSRP
jgi:hypothetical protein